MLLGQPCSYSNSDAVSAAELFALKALAIVEPCEGLLSMRDTALKQTKFSWKEGLWEFVVKAVVLKASGRSLLTTHSDRTYTYIYAQLDSHMDTAERSCIYKCIYILIQLWPTQLLRLSSTVTRLQQQLPLGALKSRRTSEFQ